MKVLVTGGAGYIGSHTAKQLAKAGYEPVVLDNLRHGHKWAVRWGPLLELDLSDRKHLDEVFKKHRFQAVIHFAAFAYVGESMEAPAEYFRNNVVNTMNLLDAMRANSVNSLVFSSSCAVYGNPQQIPIAEDHPVCPVNPYGESKLMVERMLAWYGRIYDLKSIALRYFNAAGADPDGEIGEVHQPETHLIPRALAAARGDLHRLDIFGSDYHTEDGTAVRDYIHVTDLATAHMKALGRLDQEGKTGTFNLGTGSGHSIRQVVSMVESVSQREVPVICRPQRPGDPPTLVADASRARTELGWEPQYSSLRTIIETAWNWYNERGSAQREGKSERSCETRVPALQSVAVNCAPTPSDGGEKYTRTLGQTGSPA